MGKTGAGWISTVFSVWGPEDRRHWDEQFSALDRPGAQSIRADITVPDALAGRLWRMTVARLNPGIEVDPAIPTILATSSDRWFQPGPETPGLGKNIEKKG